LDASAFCICCNPLFLVHNHDRVLGVLSHDIRSHGWATRLDQRLPHLHIRAVDCTIATRSSSARILGISQVMG
jgi:hypothetical protein